MKFGVEKFGVGKTPTAGKSAVCSEDEIRCVPLRIRDEWHAIEGIHEANPPENVFLEVSRLIWPRFKNCRSIGTTGVVIILLKGQVFLERLLAFLPSHEPRGYRSSVAVAQVLSRWKPASQDAPHFSASPGSTCVYGARSDQPGSEQTARRCPSCPPRWRSSLFRVMTTSLCVKNALTTGFLEFWLFKWLDIA